jgi:hypothetical protein
MATLASQLPHSAPGADGIPNAFLQVLGDSIIAVDCPVGSMIGKHYGILQ